MKTPEEMAEEYVDQFIFGWEYRHIVKRGFKDAFLAGYQVAKDQLADADKVMFEMEQFAEVLYADMPMAKKAFLRGYRETKEKLNVSSSQWISVKDRLPNKEQVVIWWNDGNKQMMIEDLYGVSVDDDEATINPLKFITHWMPLPTAPEGEG